MRIVGGKPSESSRPRSMLSRRCSRPYCDRLSKMHSRPSTTRRSGPGCGRHTASGVDEAQRVLDERIDQDMLAEMRELAEAKIDDLREKFEELRNELRVPVPYGLDLPELVIPEPVIDATLHGLPLISSQWTWEEMTAALKRHKSYGDQAGVP